MFLGLPPSAAGEHLEKGFQELEKRHGVKQPVFMVSPVPLVKPGAKSFVQSLLLLIIMLLSRSLRDNPTGAIDGGGLFGVGTTGVLVAATITSREMIVEVADALGVVAVWTPVRSPTIWLVAALRAWQLTVSVVPVNSTLAEQLRGAHRPLVLQGMQIIVA